MMLSLACNCVNFVMAKYKDWLGRSTDEATRDLPQPKCPLPRIDGKHSG